jgi:MYXO-CTERM domain-containing protein
MRLNSCSGLLALLTVIALPRAADAFCGFYVAGADTKLYNNATMVTLMRDGTTTVMSMRNNYQGPPEDFAMVVPVPVVLKKENVKTLPASIFERLDKLAAPRLVAYWEQDPCNTNAYGTIGVGRFGTIGSGSGTGSGYGGGRPQVVVEAQFEVGEYEIVILSARDALALETWISSNGYKIPAGAATHLKPYVESGSKFFVAKVNPKKVTFENGMANLSPLRFHYTSKEFSLPVRLGLINSSGTQDLIVHILARHQRYKVANYDNVTIPTNLIVKEEVRDQFGAFYAALFDATLAKHPGAVVTEYAWSARNCDPCPETPLSEAELMTLGLDVVGGAKAPDDMVPVPTIRVGPATVGGNLDQSIIRRYIRRQFPRLRYCYEKELVRSPKLSGSVATTFGIDSTGKVIKATAQGVDQAVAACVAKTIEAIQFPKPRGGGNVTVQYRFDYSSTMQPLGRRANQQGSEWVLTRLHTRYDQHSLGEDLTFAVAEPIAGGQGGASDTLDKGAVSASDSTFQGRYIIRHPWTGPIDCADPKRGMWGPPPENVEGDDSVAAAVDSAFAPRGGIALATLVSEPVAALDVVPAALPAATAPAPEPAAVPTPAPAPKKSGCGCSSRGDGSDPGSLLMLGFAAALACTRRRRGAPPEGRQTAVTSRY